MTTRHLATISNTDLPSVKQISVARMNLTNAAEMAISIDAVDIMSPEAPLDFSKRQLMRSLTKAVTALGYRLEPIAALVVDNTEEDFKGDITCPR